MLQYLTVKNKSTGCYIPKYIDFFEDDRNFYLVMEYGGINLADFNKRAHQYIKDGKLSLKEWKKIVKYFAWYAHSAYF